MLYKLEYVIGCSVEGAIQVKKAKMVPRVSGLYSHASFEVENYGPISDLEALQNKE